MAPSALSASSGWARGYRSASIDMSRATGASGNWPSTDWLPMITSSRSPAMRPAARIRCSRSERRIHSFPLADAEHACEGRGLAQPRGPLSRIGDERGDLRPRAAQDGRPFVQRARRVPAVTRAPGVEGATYPIEQRGVEHDLLRGQTVHGQTARLDDAVFQRAARKRVNRGLHAGDCAQARGALALAIAAHALGNGLRAAGRRAAAGADGLSPPGLRGPPGLRDIGAAGHEGYRNM